MCTVCIDYVCAGHALECSDTLLHYVTQRGYCYTDRGVILLEQETLGYSSVYLVGCEPGWVLSAPVLASAVRQAYNRAPTLVHTTMV